jgi:hypothetical protein
MRKALVALALSATTCPAFAQGIAGNPVSGSVSTTSTSATIIPAPAALRLWISAAQCGRTDTGTGAITVTLNDNAGTVIVLPGGAGGSYQPTIFNPPLPIGQAGAAAALKMTVSAGTTTVYCNAQGYNAP